jgi:hypothetical protein
MNAKSGATWPTASEAIDVGSMNSATAVQTRRRAFLSGSICDDFERVLPRSSIAASRCEKRRARSMFLEKVPVSRLHRIRQSGATMAEKRSSAKRATNEPKSDDAVSYNEFKEYEGQRYTGMKIGRSHKWYYDQGEWKETKITPDLWQVNYAVTKRRAGRAPEGSGVPVGTKYHWYVLAHQNTDKQSANDYTTSLTGLKFKIAHQRAGSEKWSATPRTQRKRMIMFLRSVLADLEKQSAREGAVISPQRKSAAVAERKVRTAHATVKRQRPASRVSAHRHSPRAARLRRAQRSAS